MRSLTKERTPIWISDPGKAASDYEPDWKSIEDPYKAGEIAVATWSC